MKYKTNLIGEWKSNEEKKNKFKYNIKRERERTEEKN